MMSFFHLFFYRFSNLCGFLSCLSIAVVFHSYVGCTFLSHFFIVSYVFINCCLSSFSILHVVFCLTCRLQLICRFNVTLSFLSVICTLGCLYGFPNWFIFVLVLLASPWFLVVLHTNCRFFPCISLLLSSLLGSRFRTYVVCTLIYCCSFWFIVVLCYLALFFGWLSFT